MQSHADVHTHTHIGLKRMAKSYTVKINVKKIKYLI